MFKPSIRIRNNRIFFILIAIFVVTLAATIFIVRYKTNEIISGLTLERVQTAKQSLNGYFFELEDRAKKRSELIASNKYFIETIKNDDYKAIKEILSNYSHGFDFVSVCDENGIIIAESHSDTYGNDASTNIAAVLLKRSETSSPISFMLNGKLVIGASAPIYDQDKLIGAVSSIFDLTKSEYLDVFKERTAYEASILLGSEQAVTTFRDQNGNRLIGTKADDIITEAILNKKNDSYIGFIDIYENTYGVHYSPLKSGNQIVGMLLTGIDVHSTLETKRTMNYWIIIASSLAIILSLVFIAVVSHIRTLHKMKKSQENLRLARDAAETANKAKSIFLANMSHEIRTPMNSIIGFSELAKDDDIPSKTREYLNHISTSAKWLLQIINDILDISKIESGRMELEHIPFDLHDIFAHCQTIITPKVMEKGITFYCYAEPSIGTKLLGDPLKLRQVLINLLSNAVKFTNHGIVKLLASIKIIDSNSATVYFEIKDSGIGMKPEQIEKIFEPFMQADESISREYGGTGLGLAISKDFIEMMGGELKVESTPGVGSKFSFEIKFEIINVPAVEPKDKIVLDEIKKPTFKGEVLICEDNSMNQLLICENLDKVGLKSVVANNGKEGLDIVSERIKNNEKPFDLIFMDIHMPVMDGLEAASKITALGVKTPMVALTANILMNDLELYTKNGLSGYLGKPFTSQELWKCLMVHFSPTAISTIDENSYAADNKALQKLLKLNFVKSNQNIYAEIQKAINKDNVKLAHRLVHTLKSNAGQIGEKKLQEVSAVAEGMLVDGKNLLTQAQSNILKAELQLVLDKLAQLFAETNEVKKTEIINEEKLREQFEKLETMLVNSNPECIDMLDDIRMIQGTEELVKQIEDFDFEKAIDTFFKIKEKKEIK